MKTYIIALGCLWSCTLLVAGCAQSQSAEGSSAKLTKFPAPEIPVVVNADPDERAKYIAIHYWDRYPFTDTTLISNADVTEQGLVDFITILQYVEPSVAEQALTNMMRGAEADSTMYGHFIELAERYLYEPNSPYRNDELYIPVLQQIVNSPILEDIAKKRPNYQLEMTLKNRVGTVAIDFMYTLSDGKKGRLHDINADYTLLFFNNPDCALCYQYKNYIATSMLFDKLISPEGGNVKLKILAFYPDNDIELWQKTDYPKQWINGSNPSVADTHLYDIRAIPSLYLLDENKNVLLRDAPIEKVEHYLSASIAQNNQ